MDESSAKYDPRADQPRSATMEAMMGQPMRERRNPERTRDLIVLAQSIAAQVEAAVPPGPERCKLRAMVEMFLND